MWPQSFSILHDNGLQKHTTLGSQSKSSKFLANQHHLRRYSHEQLKPGRDAALAVAFRSSPSGTSSPAKFLPQRRWCSVRTRLPRIAIRQDRTPTAAPPAGQLACVVVQTSDTSHTCLSTGDARGTTCWGRLVFVKWSVESGCLERSCEWKHAVKARCQQPLLGSDGAVA